MKTYSKFLTEANIKQLRHLTHIEEAILHLGFQGARESIEILRSIRDSLAGGATETNNTSVKYDGAPALIFGIDPADGQFFVGTKGVFAKTPKLVKSKDDLAKFGYQGELANKLSIALEHFPKLGVKGVVQGDMMFTQDDLQTEKIDGSSYVTFTPNTLTYAIPADSDLAKRIRRAKIGIVLHTEYHGKESLENLVATPGQVDISNLNDTPDVWYDDPYIKDVSGTATLTQSETLEVTRYLSGAGKVFQSMSKREIENLFEHFEKLPKSAVGIKLDTFINNLVRNDRLPQPGKGTKLANEYLSYMKSYWDERVIAKLKTEKKRQEKREFFDEWISGVDFKAIAKILNFMAYVNEAKQLILQKLNQGLDSMKTFVWTGDGYRVTSGEGFVISDKMSGNTWKIVDRLEFSKLNFSGQSAKFGRRG